MPNSILHKRSSTASAVPAAGSLSVGELAINTADGTLFTKKSNNSVINIITSNKLNAFASTTSTELATVISDKTGTGALIFGTSPTFSTSIITGSGSFDIFNTTATVINAFGAATTLTIGATTGTTTIRNALNVSGIFSTGEIRLNDADASNWLALKAPTTVSTNVTWTLPDADGSNGQALITNGSGILSWSTPSASAGGSNTQVQFNDGGTSLGGDSGLTYDKTTDTLTVGGHLVLNNQGDLRLADSDSSNYVGLQAPATVSANIVWTLPATDGSSNQVLTTDGSANLSWSTPSGSSASNVQDYVLFPFGII